MSDASEELNESFALEDHDEDEDEDEEMSSEMLLRAALGEAHEGGGGMAHGGSASRLLEALEALAQDAGDGSSMPEELRGLIGQLSSRGAGNQGASDSDGSAVGCLPGLEFPAVILKFPISVIVAYGWILPICATTGRRRKSALQPRTGDDSAGVLSLGANGAYSF